MRFGGWVLGVLLVGCSGKGSTPVVDARAQPSESTRPAKPRLVHGEASGDVAAEVRELAKQSSGATVVYVGASWCAPCQAFHAALERGDLDERLRGVTFIEYDSDRDGARLELADYGGRLIPRFALPGMDGRFGGTKIEGGIKGQGAVEHIMQRLEPMLQRAH